MDLRPDRARVERDGVVTEVPVETVAQDEVVIVRPGERVPVDGVILEGRKPTGRISYNRRESAGIQVY